MCHVPILNSETKRMVKMGNKSYISWVRCPKMENDMSMDLLNQNDQRILLSIFHLKIRKENERTWLQMQYWPYDVRKIQGSTVL